MRATHPGISADKVSEELLTWLGTQTDQPYNPLLDVECEYPSPFEPRRGVFDELTDLVSSFLNSPRSFTRYSCRDITYHSAWCREVRVVWSAFQLECAPARCLCCSPAGHEHRRLEDSGNTRRLHDAVSEWFDWEAFQDPHANDDLSCAGSCFCRSVHPYQITWRAWARPLDFDNL